MLQHDQRTCARPPRAEAIAQLNDQLRMTGRGGQIVVTKGVAHLTGFNTQTLMSALANYEGFDADNDPHGERDFGDLTLFGADLLFKIDYYDNQLRYGSEDPADSTSTKRVLTVLRAEEW